MGVTQDVLKFSDPTDPTTSTAGKDDADYFGRPGPATSASSQQKTDDEDPMIEITPPDLISALITETEIMTPNAVSEELIKLWF